MRTWTRNNRSSRLEDHSGGSKFVCFLCQPHGFDRPYPENQTEIGKLSGFQGQTRPVWEVSGGPTAADLIWLMVLECGQLLGWGMSVDLFLGDFLPHK